MREGGDAWVLLCEHARAAVPRAYRSLGLRRAQIRDHIGWDIGAHALQRVIAERLAAPWVASRWSRLLIDCNRDRSDTSLILPTSDGVVVPGNARVPSAERRRRLATYYEPYHAAVERTLARSMRRRPDARHRLLALHSFTPVMAGLERKLDIGVLFDEYPTLARRFGRALAERGYRVRYNQPYSGRAGLIYSARRHGNAAGIEYVELEVNNALLREQRSIERVGRDVAGALIAMGRRN